MAEHDHPATTPDPPPSTAAPQASAAEGLRFLVDGGRLAEVDGFVELALDGSLVGYSRSLLEVYGVGAGERERLAGIGEAGAHQRALAAVIAGRVADPPARPLPREPAPSPGETTFEDVPLVDGRVVERYGVPLRRTDGSVAGRLFVVRDVTARRRADAEQRARARQQEAVADLGARALRETDLRSFLDSAVRRAADVFQPGSEVHLLTADASGRLGVRASSAGDRGAPCDLLGARLEPGDPPAGTGPPLRVPVSGRTRSPGLLCVHLAEGRWPTRDEAHLAETVAHILSAALGRHEAERALAEREREARAVFDHSQDALVTFDDLGQVVASNPAARRLLAPGASADRGAWKSFESELRLSWGTLRTTGRTGGELEVRLPGHPVRQLEWSAIAWILPGRHLAVLRDVTEARRVQGRLALSERLASVGRLAGGVAHELNNPLAGLFANLAFVAEQLGHLPAGDEAGEVSAALRDASAAAERMRDVIRDLQLFSRGEVGALGTVDARSVVESSLAKAGSAIRHRARLVRDLAPVPPVRAPEARLGQVVLRLILNAAQSIPEGDAARNEIRVSTRPSGARVCIEVADTGCGISPENLTRIFDPFFTTRPVGSGTGLGLPVCLGIVQALGGTIEVESDPGRGSTFRVLLPASVGPETRRGEGPARVAAST
jgi:signal transduction histidine kinase